MYSCSAASLFSRTNLADWYCKKKYEWSEEALDYLFFKTTTTIATSSICTSRTLRPQQ